MGYAAFQEKFPELGAAECRVVMLPDGAEVIPPGSYAFVEFYCRDTACDCRRVLFFVIEERTGEHVASISFGFDRQAATSGPFLDPLNKQSALADEILAVAEDLVLSDEAYVARLERHYRMFRDAGGRALPAAEVQERIAVRKSAKKRLRRIQGQRKRRKRTCP